jgi:hypothetical protein
MMVAARTSETLVNFYQTTRCYNPEDSNLHTHRRENLKSYMTVQNPTPNSASVVPKSSVWTGAILVRTTDAYELRSTMMVLFPVAHCSNKSGDVQFCKFILC